MEVTHLRRRAHLRDHSDKLLLPSPGPDGSVGDLIVDISERNGEKSANLWTNLGKISIFTIDFGFLKARIRSATW